MAITALPTAPQRTDSPDVFATRADAWVAALDQFTTEANALQTDVNAKQVLAAASETAAELAETNAETAQTASEAAQLASENARDIALAAVAALPEGTINDLLIASDKTWSSTKITSEILEGRLIETVTKTSIYTVLDTDRAKLIRCSGTFNLNFSSAATLGSGWYAYVHNVSSGTVTIEPYNTETIDGVANASVEPDGVFLVISDGTNLQCVKLSNPKPHYITSSQTWICPAGVYSITIELWGGGGGGSRNNDGALMNAGGNGGAYAKKTMAISPGTSKSITIGAAGTAATDANTAGTSGGTSSFSTDITCTGGGTGVQSYISNASGGIASGGDININGGKGTSAQQYSVAGCSFSNTHASTHLPYSGQFPGGGGLGGNQNMPAYAGAAGLCIIWY